MSVPKCIAILVFGVCLSCHSSRRSQADDPSDAVAAERPPIGDALHDPDNPIRRLFGGQRLDLWSLQPIVRPSVPEVVNDDWSINPIDRFVLEQWQREGLAPAPDVDARTLLRRGALDLVGIAPSFESIEAVAREFDDLAYDRWIEALLASPEYGEHWARMWLDVVRYSDSNGFDWDEFRRYAWRYRDYVIQAWNADVPFDRFVREQLAGDELVRGEPKSLEEQRALIATGYLRMGPHDNAASLFNEQDRARAELLADLTETTASAFLGLTMSCCRCHDHKTDPLSHEDHYRFRAFFAACKFDDERPLDLADRFAEIQSHNEPIDRELEPLRERLRKLDEKKKKSKSAEQDALKQQIELLTERRLQPTTGMLMTDRTSEIDSIHVLKAGDHRTKLQEVAPGFPSVLFPGKVDCEPQASEATTGRRLTLANWIVARENPWTARVIVNRLWQRHFGEGIVDMPNDFGVTGNKPSNAALLDYLACELIDSGWSLKHIQRLIVTSRTYRLKAVPEPSSSRKEVDGSVQRFVSMRRSLKRLSAEQFRDNLLAAADQLQDRAGGPPVWPKLSDDVLQTNPAVLDDNETKTKGWYPSAESEQNVRSIYLVQKRTLKLPWLETFDLPDNATSCPKREASIVAPQALTMMNGELASQVAHGIAARIASTIDDAAPASQVDEAFRLTLQRLPSESERETCVRYLGEHTLTELSLVLINTNEFVFVP